MLLRYYTHTPRYYIHVLKMPNMNYLGHSFDIVTIFLYLVHINACLDSSSSVIDSNTIYDGAMWTLWSLNSYMRSQKMTTLYIYQFRLSELNCTLTSQCKQKPTEMLACSKDWLVHKEPSLPVKKCMHG